MLGRLRLLVMLSAALAVTATAAAEQLTPTEQRAAIDAAATLIEQRYVDPDRGRSIARALRQSRGAWAAPIEADQFAAQVTKLLRDVSKDGHLGLSYSATPLPEETGEAEFNAAEMLNWYGPQLNHGVERIERLAGNIMLLDLRVFPPAEMAGDVFAAAMTVVAQGDALIIDLRRNGGGADTANLVIGYLVPGGSPLSGAYDRPSNTTTPNQSPSWVPGRRFGATKPVFILTSHRTFSAAESVAYDLQALKRATIIGETTGGGAHPFEYRRIHPHFAVDLPEARSINPITGTNWQGVGVKPDVAVRADQALDTAIALARAAIDKARAAIEKGRSELASHAQ